MNGEWCYFKNYFSKEFCDELIENALTIDPIEAGVSSNGTEIELSSSFRRSKVRFIHSNDWRFRNLFDELWKTQITANRDFFNFHVTKLDSVQFTEYDESYLGEYKEHQDVIWLNGDQNSHRKLSCVINLSDPDSYGGGDFELTKVSNHPHYPDIRMRGTIIYFPSFIYHKANPVIRGKRYSLVAWFEGPRWR